MKYIYSKHLTSHSMYKFFSVDFEQHTKYIKSLRSNQKSKQQLESDLYLQAFKVDSRETGQSRWTFFSIWGVPL